MGFSTRICVSERDAPRLMTALATAGFIVLDRGERVSTEEGLFSEATLDLIVLPQGS